jgi:hypothetical protein
MILVGKSAQFSQMNSNQTRNTLSSMMDFRWNQLSPENNEVTDSFNLSTNSETVTDYEKEKMSQQILRFEKFYRDGFSEETPPEGINVLSGLHLSGKEVTDFFNSLIALNQSLQGMSWEARKEIYRMWFVNGGKFVLASAPPLILAPYLVSLTPLAHTPVHTIAELGALFGYVYSLFFLATPVYLVPVNWTLHTDFKFKNRLQNMQNLINNPKEGAWFFSSSTQPLHKSYLDYWISPKEHSHPLMSQAIYEASPNPGTNKNLITLETAQLLRFTKDANSQLVPTLDIVLRFTKDSPPAPKTIKETKKLKALVPFQVPTE